MSFFDSKEEVIDIELTQYGKHLLSTGKFSPKLYAFFDDDILYDAQYSNIVENSVEIQNRIEEETPRLKTQYVFSSIEKDVRRGSVNPVKSNHKLLMPLGNSEIGINKMPAWKIQLLKGKIKDISNLEIISSAEESIPQINIDPITYKLHYDANLSLVTKEEFGLFDIREMNSIFQNENFYIEVFLVEKVDSQGNLIIDNSTSYEEKLIKLAFKKTNKKIKDGFLVDFNGTSIEERNSSEDPSYVNYWFNIVVDDYIDEELLTQIEIEEKENIFLTMGKESKFKGTISPSAQQNNDIITNIMDSEAECKR